MAIASLDQLNLTVEAKGCLQKAGISNVESLSNTPFDEIAQLSSMTEGMFNEVTTKLYKFYHPEIMY